MDEDPLSEQLKLTLEEASEELEQYGVPFGQFNCLEGPEKCKKAQIQEIPDIKFIRCVYRSFLRIYHISSLFSLLFMQRK